MSTIIKAQYNVGVFSGKNLFLGTADSQPFLFIGNGLAAAGDFEYLPSDAVRAAMALGDAVIDSRLDLDSCDNRAVPPYTVPPAAGKFNQVVSIGNYTGTMTDVYHNAPFYSIMGTGIAAYSAVAQQSLMGTMNAEAAATAGTGGATTPTGIAAIDGIISFAEKNWILLVVGFLALDYTGVFAPFNIFGKKKKKAKK